MKPTKRNMLIAACSLMTLLLCTGSSCNDEQQETNVIPPQDEQGVLLNQPYGPDPRHRYDIYLPANRSEQATPVLFFVHGGGWTSGNKEDCKFWLDALQPLFPEYAYVMMSYRLVSEAGNKFPAQEEDLRACVEKVMGMREEYKISDRIGLMGGSAGAHMALLEAYKYGPTSGYNPKAVLSLCGPTDITSLYGQIAPQYIGILYGCVGTPGQDDELIRSSSPYAYVTAESSPTLLLYGAIDDLVPAAQAEMLRDKLQQQHVPVVCDIYPDDGHSLPKSGAAAMQQVVAFLKNYLK